MTLDLTPAHRGLRIEADITEPIVSWGDALHMDALLAYARFVLLPEAERAALPPIDDDPAPRDFPLPLSRWQDAGTWGWLASAPVNEWAGHGAMEVRKPVPASAWRDWSSVQQATPGAGRMKACDIRYPTLLAPRVEWIAWGDRSEVRHLIRIVRAIGKKTALGYGRVAHWRVSHDDTVTPDAICAARVMPCADGEMFAVRPPYHHPSRRVPARLPLCR